MKIFLRNHWYRQERNYLVLSNIHNVYYTFIVRLHTPPLEKLLIYKKNFISILHLKLIFHSQIFAWMMDEKNTDSSFYMKFIYFTLFFFTFVHLRTAVHNWTEFLNVLHIQMDRTFTASYAFYTHFKCVRMKSIVFDLSKLCQFAWKVCEVEYVLFYQYIFAISALLIRDNK